MEIGVASPVASGVDKTFCTSSLRQRLSFFSTSQTQSMSCNSQIRRAHHTRHNASYSRTFVTSAQGFTSRVNARRSSCVRAKTDMTEQISVKPGGKGFRSKGGAWGSPGYLWAGGWLVTQHGCLHGLPEHSVQLAGLLACQTGTNQRAGDGAAGGNRHRQSARLPNGVQRMVSSTAMALSRGSTAMVEDHDMHVVCA